jgi:hypothetical protein
MTHHYARLQKRDPKRNQYCYYLLDVQPNLFGRRSSSSVSIRTVCQTLPIKRMSMSRTPVQSASRHPLH